MLLFVCYYGRGERLYPAYLLFCGILWQLYIGVFDTFVFLSPLLSLYCVLFGCCVCASIGEEPSNLTGGRPRVGYGVGTVIVVLGVCSRVYSGVCAGAVTYPVVSLLYK